METIFLGGTTDNDYRPGFIKRLESRGLSSDRIFNPVVEHWGDDEKRLEDKMKASPTVLMLYYLTGNEAGIFLSFYSLHEALMGLYDDPDRTVVVFDYNNLVPRAAGRLKKVCKDLKRRFPEAPIFESLDDSEEWLGQNFM